MRNGCRRYTLEVEARVVLEIISQQGNLSQASRECRVLDSAIPRWKQEFIEQSPLCLSRDRYGTSEIDVSPNWSGW